MELSKRLNFIINKLDKVESLIDVGTDHGYIPIYALKNGLCDKAIASDVNKEPLDKARLNAVLEGVGEELDFRLGNGLSVIKEKEAQAVIIAGMGGNLIRDILEDSIGIVNELDYLVLQPAQNPEVLREYLYTNDYEIIQEDLCLDEGKYYELFKVKRKDGENTILDNIYYEISPKLLMEKHPLMKEYLSYKLDQYNKIVSFITDDTPSANSRKEELTEKISVLSNMINFL
ncbi:tRNA (adenine(22)-N(1))-methyltransferase [Clostridium chauvoei]|uniref:SAM-dependent methyltransferase n=2 Tax=Clostridium chauvoei TaxID=46867 RepID=S6EQ15_9CLOT|nr:class I SAM-dependent methyltransferase [Clostridium chauvoei]ATD54717.1 SAM-dependent methyltransferase [Clostridium chauvoei]ATD57601.1 SAM-dependent methyltransferase [Clostridium chauvoei]MBX7280015.1 class I SAM-dependent methyltransferase [Clostridium chauvoei]MBX7282326.1 class I SAM-dependent methyltransferase [Clostridium chauvoei]MBX7284906.1 class I SAM-dependent methyltransferase [Clostridium chauvoei]